MSLAEIRQMIKIGGNNPMKSIDAGKHNVFVWFEHRGPEAGRGPGGQAELHTQLTEIYLIVEGTGTIATGGKVLSPARAEINAILPGTVNMPRFANPTFSGRLVDGISRKVSAGDILVMPPNTAHSWVSIEPPGLDYLIFRIDPEKVLHAGYVHPLLKQ